MKHELRIMVFSSMILASLFIIPPAYASADIGQSRIHPASPLYFLKSVREILELKFAGTTRVRAYRQLEFATRRLREVNSLLPTSRQDLIVPTLERYAWHMGELRGIVGLRDVEMMGKVSSTTQAHMDTLLSVYQQVSSQDAKRSLRATVYRLTEWDQELIEKLESVSETSFNQQIAKSKLSGCQFLSQEASNSALNEVERSVLAERSEKCLLLR